MLRLLVLFLLVLTSCSQTLINADSHTQSDSDFLLDEPEKLTLCQIQNDPASYNHKLVEVTGFISHGFEDSSIFDLTCESKQGIWVEYGGKSATGTMYCCDVTAARQRSEALIVEDVPTSLVEDEQFRSLDKLLQKQPDAIAHATVVGRFFAGEKSKYSEDERWSGYGHMGCCSLLVIQKVVSVEPQDRKDLDYRASADQPDIKKGGGYRILRSDETAIENQRKAEVKNQEWVFNDPRRVAIETLAKLLKIDEKNINKIKQTGRGRERKSVG